MEKEIADYLKDKYGPEAIVLAGSRAQGTALEDSDWDLFLLGAKQKDGEGFMSFQNNLLDVSLKDWPEGDKPLTIPFGPLWPVKVLLDGSNGKLETLLKITEEASKKGPLDLYREACLKRLEKLDRWVSKIKKYQNTPEVQYFYSGIFYEFVIRTWFEVQNLWPLPPRDAIKFIDEKDNRFKELLSDFVRSSGEKQALNTNKIMGKLNELAKSLK